jgi:BirA family biotin operon repressor/biotin-[acetyl-CoA-carboxylase] ligase
MSDNGRKFGEGIAWPEGWDVRYVTETGSTNADLLADLDAGRAGHRAVLATGYQTAGKGRLNRRWDAPADTNLLASVAFREVPEHPVDLSRRLGLALCAVLDTLPQDVPSGLKWPNDVLLGGLKLAGLLAVRSGATGAVVVGMGVNVSWSPDGAARLSELDPDLGPDDLLCAVLAAHDRLPADVTDLYRQRLLTLGAQVRAHLPDGSELAGRAVDIDAAGRLAVIDECAITHHLDAADVVHLRPVS